MNLVVPKSSSTFAINPSNHVFVKKLFSIGLTILTFIMTGCGDDPFLNSDTGIFKDLRDKNEYNWVRIGDQVWMAENLAYLPSLNSYKEISENKSRYYVWAFDIPLSNSLDSRPNIRLAKSDSSYIDFGVLYNWVAAIRSCPNGWHLPGDEEWKTLEIQLGMSPMETNDYLHIRESGMVGKKLKATVGWNGNGNGDNLMAFNALPGGYLRYYWEEDQNNFDSTFIARGYSSHFWSSSEAGLSSAWNRELYFNSDGVRRGTFTKNIGASVRCIKD